MQATPRAPARVHLVYLAVIAVLVTIVVVVVASTVRARQRLEGAVAMFGDKVRASLPRAGALKQAPPTDPATLRTFSDYRREVDALIARAADLDEFGPPSRLAGACAKALRGGKRVRSVILIEVARATAAQRAQQAAAAGKPAPTPADVSEVALFIEYVHAASLVIDDLPAFDNDLTRRGRPSLHAEEGQAVAQMAALSLIAAAFQNVCRQVDWLRDHCPEISNVDRIGTRICSMASQALGARGAAGGQYLDVSPADVAQREHGPDAVIGLMRMKTACLFEIATVVGWLAAGGEPASAEALRGVGRDVGMAFQIADDIGDMERDAARAAEGRPAWNFATIYGREAAVRNVESHLAAAAAALRQQGLWSPFWDELGDKVRGMMVDDAAPAAIELPVAVEQAAAHS